jgi:Tfp pilus assembly protein PilF
MLAAAVGVAGAFLIPRYRANQSLATARQLVADGHPEQSRRPYKEYLYKNGDDIPVLDEYIGVCERVLPDRRRVLADAGRAIARLVQLEPDNPARKTQLLDFYRKYRFWAELESAATLYGGSDLAAMEPALAYDRVVAVQEQGKLDQAVQELRAYIDLGRELRDTPLRMARAYVELRDQPSADAVFPSLLEKYPQDAMLHVYYALYLLDRGKVDEAAAQLAMVPEANQSEVDFAIASIRLDVAREEFTEALALADKALAANPGHVELELNYVLALERADKRELAMEYIEKMSPQFRVDTPGFVMFLTEMRLEAGDADGGDETRKMYMEAYPDQQSVDQYLTGRILLSRKAIKEARDKFAIAVEMNPNLYRASYFLAICELELGDKTKARGPLEQYLRNNPTDQQARRLWTRHFDTVPSLSELQAKGNRLLSEASPTVEDILFTIEDLLVHRQEADQQLALRLMEKVLAIAPRDPRGYSALAGFYLERGEIPAAEKVLQDATAIGVAGDSFPLIRTSILLLKGDKEGAMATAKEHLDKSPGGEVETWASFFARQGYFSEGDDLVKAFGGEGTPGSETDDPLLFRLTLALQYNHLDEARARVAEAEASRGQNPELQPVLNRMRLALAEGLVVNSPELPRAEVDGLLAKVREHDPQNDGLKIVDARILMKSALPDVHKARELVSSVTADSHVYLQALQVQAEIAAMQGHHSTVENLARTILEKSASNTQVMHLLADAQLGQNDRAGAQATLERILAYDRSDTRAMRLLVRLYEQMNLPQRADEMFARFKEGGRNRPGHAAQVEELRTFLGRSDGTTAAAPTPESQAAAGSYAALTTEVASLVGQKKFPEAIARVQAYLKENPSMAEPWVFLGQVILSQGEGADLGAASSAFTRAQIIMPEYGPAQLGLIDVQIRGNNLAMAVSICERYLLHHDRDADVMFRLATLLAPDPARRAESLDWVTRALTIDERPAFIRFRAYLLTQIDRHDEAIADLTRLIKLVGTTTAEDEMTLAEAYLGKGDGAGAKEHVDAASKLIPKDDARLAARLKQIEERMTAGGDQ